jgi:hypothetical protein
MKIVAIMPVRNESWILGLSLRAVLMWADEVICLDHCSTDNSLGIMSEVALENWKDGESRVTILIDRDATWNEMAHRNALLNTARSRGATHIAIVDADEVLSGNLLPDIRGIFAVMQAGQDLQLPWVCLARSIDAYYSDGPWFYSMVSCGFRDAPELHWSSVSRGGYDFHQRPPMGRQLLPFRPVEKRAGGMMHLQFVDEERLKAKQALYKITEVLRWPGRSSVQELNDKYGRAVYESDPRRFRLAQVPFDWWAPYKDILRHLTLIEHGSWHCEKDIPWQEREVMRLLAEHGRDKFAGLDLFGYDVP